MAEYDGEGHQPDFVDQVVGEQPLGELDAAGNGDLTVDLVVEPGHLVDEPADRQVRRRRAVRESSAARLIPVDKPELFC